MISVEIDGRGRGSRTRGLHAGLPTKKLAMTSLKDTNSMYYVNPPLILGTYYILYTFNQSRKYCRSAGGLGTGAAGHLIGTQ